jgi:cell division protein FtsW
MARARSQPAGDRAVYGLMALIAVLLMLQPDFGSTILFGGVWFVLVLLSGISLKRIGGVIGGGMAR